MSIRVNGLRGTRSGGGVPGPQGPPGPPGPVGPPGAISWIDVTAAPHLADPTGQQDASAAIQSAVNAAAPGDMVFAPAGTYKISATISLLGKAVNFVGAGRGNTLIFAPAAGTSGIVPSTGSRIAD